MEYFLVFFATTTAIIFAFLITRKLAVNRNKVEGEAVPEAPGSWPIIGHLHLLAGSQLPHKFLGSMADKMGPIFTIKLGAPRTLIVSSSEMAKECFTTNDRAFASRPKAMVTELMGYNYANFSLAPYGPYWRELRKIIVLELVSDRRLQELAHIRASEVDLSIKDIYEAWMKNKGCSEMVKIDMKQWFENLTLNIIVKMISGHRYLIGDEDGDRFKKAVRRYAELLEAFVPSDAIPWLRFLDLGGYEKEMKKTAKEMDVIMEEWLQEHRKKMESGELVEGKQQVFMGSLLSCIEGEFRENLSGFDANTIVKSTCLAILAAATDTTTVTLTWALALLINNLHVLKKAQQELDNNVGRGRQVAESDLTNLAYLQAIIKETMRLYPAAPLSVPHESSEDCTVGGYNVPRGTRLLVNIWKIHHDPKIWADPFEFRPERFLTCEKAMDVKGQHFELIPFGSGRRICLGIPFALQAMQLILATLIHGFEFESLSTEPIDMTESRGLTNLKVTPLELLVSPRLSPGFYECVVPPT